METYDSSNLQQSERGKNEYIQETSEQEEKEGELEAITIYHRLCLKKTVD